MATKLTICSDFKNGDPIPARYAGDGADISPPFLWMGVPPTTVSLALVMVDADAPPASSIHWLLYDIPAATRKLSAGTPRIEMLPLLGKARQGRTSFQGKVGYVGPRPAAREKHRYYFRFYAINRMLGLKPGATFDELRKAVAGAVLGEAELMGTYQGK